MAHDNKSNEQPESPTFLANSIAAKSTTSAGDLRNAPTRRSPKASQKRPTLPVHAPRTSDDNTSLVTIPRNVLERLAVPEGIDKRRMTSESPTPDVTSLHTQSPPFSVPNASRNLTRKSRARTSHIHEYAGVSIRLQSLLEGLRIGWRHGSHLPAFEEAHSIDSTASGAARKTTQERAVMDAAAYRNLRTEPKPKKPERKRRQLVSTGLPRSVYTFSGLKARIIILH